MIRRSSRSLEVLSISALDLFASALGVFILVAILLFPFYLKQPSIEAALDGARTMLSAAASANTLTKERSATAAAERNAALAELRAAQAALAEAETVHAAMRETAQTASTQRQSAERQQATTSREFANLFITDLDLVFVMDATGSMDDEIADVQANLLGIVRVLDRLAPSLWVGFVAYKDRGESYVTQSFPLTEMRRENLQRAQEFVDSLVAEGGGDHPEALDIALAEALAMQWRDEAQGRIVIVGDAPAPRARWGAMFNAIDGFTRTAVPPALPRQVSAVFSGSLANDRRFFEELANAGGGDFIAHRGQMMESVLLSVLTEDRTAQ